MNVCVYVCVCMSECVCVSEWVCVREYHSKHKNYKLINNHNIIILIGNKFESVLYVEWENIEKEYTLTDIHQQDMPVDQS